MATGNDSTAHRLATLRDRLSDGMDRRSFLRTVANAGYALGMAHFLGVEDFLGVDDGSVPVVTAFVREDYDDPWSLAERTREVPADWYARVSKAFELHERLVNIPITGYFGSAVSPGSYRQGTASISIEVATDDFGQIAETINTVLENVWVDDYEIQVGLDHLEDDREFEPRLATNVFDGHVPGGVRCETGSGYATLAPALYHPEEGTSFFATAEHAYRDGDDEASLTLPQRDGDAVELGKVQYAHPVEDVVAVESSGDVQPASEIDGATPRRVIGQFTRLGLADLAARGEPLEKVGAQTGHSSGKIGGIDAVTCLTDTFCRRGQLRWAEEHDLADGDSGSVSYHPDPDAPDDGVLVAGFNNARTWWPGQDYVWGVSAYELTNQYGYHF